MGQSIQAHCKKLELKATDFKEVKAKEEFEKILLCDVQIKICPDIEKSFLNLLHNSGYTGFRLENKIDFQELYNNRFN